MLIVLQDRVCHMRIRMIKAEEVAFSGASSTVQGLNRLTTNCG